MDLTKLSNDELKELCDISKSEAKYDEMVDQSEEIKKLENERELLLASVRSLSEFNLGRRDSYHERKIMLSSLLAESIMLKEAVKYKAKTFLEISEKKSLEIKVSAATSLAEDDSDNIAHSFLESKINFDHFIVQYLEKRKLAYLRRTKADKLRQDHSGWVTPDILTSF